MSLPLKRRLARAALLVAAGAAPLVGAGVAQAAPAQSPAELAGLSSPDSTPLGEALDSTAQSAATTAGEIGGEVVRQGVPAAGKAVGSLGKNVAPPVEDAQQLAGKAFFDTAMKLDQALPEDNLLQRGVSTDNLARDLIGTDLPVG
ncbi:ATP-binding protein [Streptomyces sp. HSW2009]|uniref:ATP-binding protein n=1 Tax=Streptomyces sp. HSW2009 TaxID=3142890 RepID=UPI0032F00722